MSIQNSTYQLCKSVQKSEKRKVLANLIIALNFGKSSHFGYMARNFTKYPKLQILGYLLVDQHREKLEESHKIKLDSLEDDEVYLLMSAHKQLTELNRLCVSPLVEKIPEVKLAIDPYNIFPYDEKPFDKNYDLLDKQSIENLALTFHKHPAINIALETAEILNEEINEEHYFQDVGNFSQELLDATPFKSPEWLSEVRRQRENNARKMHLRHMLALVSIRDSLANINQLIFQAILRDKLVIIDEDNIIDLSPTYNSDSGSAITVTCQTSDAQFLIPIETPTWNVGILVLLKGIYGYKDTQLGRIETSHTNIFGESDTAKFEIRIIDENMNAFPGILGFLEN
jgi:hypothetical protein